jgi:restriction endonuclease S subunit
MVSRIFCPGRFTRKYVDEESGGVPFLGGANILHFSVNTRKFLSKDDPNLEELIVREGWLLITRSGSTGIVSSVPKAWDGVAISEHVIRVVPDKSKPVSAEYLEAYLRSDLGQNLIAAGVFGSVID